MYDIPELEKKWRKYRRNRIKKPIIIGLSTLILLGGVGYVGLKYLNNNNDSNSSVVKKSLAATNTQNVKKTQPTQPKVEKVETPAMVITKTPANGQMQPKAVAVAPSNSVNSNSDDTIDLSNATIVQPNVPDDEIRVIGFDNNKEKKEIKKKYQEILAPKQTEAEIREKEELAVYEERFKSTQDPQDSLYLAKYYYKKGNYDKAETWAVNTNSIDGDIEDSWIIFAKARAKQGHRVDAIKVLQSYYDETSSAKAKELLDKLRRNIPFK